jgi:hypothetical protein
MGSGPQTDKHLPQGPLTGQFLLDDDILHCLLYESYLSTGYTIPDKCGEVEFYSSCSAHSQVPVFL